MSKFGEKQHLLTVNKHKNKSNMRKVDNLQNRTLRV